MEIKELGHVVLFVSDVERSRRFYGDILGWSEVIREEPRAGRAMFTSGRTHHELLLIEVGSEAEPIPQGRRLGMYHIGLKVGTTDDELGLRSMTSRSRACGSSAVRIMASRIACTSWIRTATRSSCISTCSRKYGGATLLP